MTEEEVIQIETIATGVVMSVEEGEADSLEAYAKLKGLSDILAACTKQVYVVAVSDAEDWEEKSFEHKGIKFTKVAGGKRYTYDKIPAWKEKKQELKDIEADLKIAYAAYEKGRSLVDSNGEVSELPGVTYSADGLRVKIIED